MTYKEQQDVLNYEKINDILKQEEMPSFMRDFVNGYKGNFASSRTILGYVRDISTFFYYLEKEYDIDRKSITAKTLEGLSPLVIDGFKSFLNGYRKEGVKSPITNGREAVNRKLTALRRLYDYLYRMDIIGKNPCIKVNLVPLKQEDKRKNIIALDKEEVAGLLASAEQGKGLGEKQKKFTEALQLRDSAILTLLLSTGMRVSECVGINLDDVSFEKRTVNIVRKGYSKGQTIHIDEETCEKLKDYVANERKDSDIDPEALFISRKGQRLTVRSVERLVKKYAVASGTIKKVTPHKLRSTYGSALLRQTGGDLDAVATRLGHSSVDTTRKNYIQESESVDEAVADLNVY